MQKTIKARSGRVLIMPTPEEDAAITAAAMSDPDATPFTDSDWDAVKHVAIRGRPLGSGNKMQVTLRLDIDVVEKLKAEGAGWQTRANAVLRKSVMRNSKTTGTSHA
jgi:uncharacterized protein (DUF4415 family)